MGMGSTHHLEGVGEGKVMVLGVGWMLSLFVVEPADARTPSLVRFFSLLAFGP
jgi:hypothetical protein